MTSPKYNDDHQIGFKWITQFVSPQVLSYLGAGGVAGAASRTVVSPLERIKILQQVQSQASGDTQYRGVWRSLVRIWNEEGFAGFMRGNGINCLRIVPYSAVQFTTYEMLKKWLSQNGQKELTTPWRLMAGALAGIASVSTTYPLDLVRARLSIASASLALQVSKASNVSPATAMKVGFDDPALRIWPTTVKIMKEEGGIRGLYRGLIPTAFGVAPYVGLNFSVYELLRGYITPPGQESAAYAGLVCGAMAGTISQTLTYPFDVLRRKMQTTTMGGGALGYQYNGALHALSSIMRIEGLPGLYRGIWPNLLKVAPSIAVSFYTYETAKKWLLSL